MAKRASCLYSAVAGLFTAMIAWLLFAVLILYERQDYYLKRSFLMPQRALAMLGAGGILLLCLALRASENRLAIRRAAYGWRAWMPRLVPWALLLALQAFVSYHAYFLCDWDVGNTLDSAYNMAMYGGYINHAYFSMYPNNVLLAECFAAVIRLFHRIAGEPGLDRCVLILILIQCVLNTFTGMLCSWAAKRMTGSDGFAVAAGAVYVLLVGISPWTMIPYSDGMALIIPMAVFCLYLLQINGHRRKLCWFGVGALTAVGYMLKPQAAIMTIAVALMECAHAVQQQSDRVWLRKMGSMLLALAIGLGPVQGAIVKNSLIEVDETKNVGMLHFLMMGLNRETSGTYSFEDQMLSTSVENPAQRAAMQIGEIRQRLSDMGVSGFLDLMKEKTLINFGDGTFAWGINGVFFHKMIEDKDDFFSPLFKDLLYTSGGRYPAFATLLQGVWLGVLTGCALALLAMRGRDEKQKRSLCILLLSLIGLTVFEWLFEAKARYLYLYAPQFVLLGVCGLWQLAGMLRRKK